MSSLAKAIVYGAASLALYALLFLVHGAFTGSFWDALGLRPVDKKRRK
jgi:hypothetical protein